MSDFGLPQRTTGTMHAIFAKHSGVKKVTIYGSRAMGNYRNGSDIDLTMFGDALGYEDVSRIAGELDDSDIPYLVDLSIFDQLDHAKLKDHINRVGKVFYDRYAGWRTVKLGDVCEFIRGLTYSKKDETAYSQTAVLRATNVDLNTYSLTFDKIRYISDDVKIKDEKYAKAGDIIMCTASGSKSHLGKVALVTKDTGMAFGGFMAALRTSESCLSSYLYLVLRSPRFSTHLTNVSDGASINNLKFSQISNFELSLPPLPQQQRIVAKLDAVFAEIDRAIAAVENSKDHLNSILKNTLTVILNGSLGWKDSRLDQLCVNLDSKRIPITKPKREEGSIPYYGASGIIDYVKDWLFDEDILLVSEDGANLLMRTYPIAFSVSTKCWVNNHAHVLKFTDRDIQSWVEIYLNSIDLSDHISGMAQPKINQKKLNSILIPLPSTEKLTEVLNRVKSITGHLDTYQKLNEGRVANYHALKSAFLAQELQTETE